MILAQNRIFCHRIYDRFFKLLENKKVRFLNNKEPVPFVLHERTKRELLINDGMSVTEINELEDSILSNAENFADLEIIQDVPFALHAELEKTNEVDLIFKKRAVPVPSKNRNLYICIELENEFGQDEVLACDGFVWSNGGIRLDIYENSLKDGFITPQMEKETGFICGLKVFRHPNDNRPFILRSRQNYQSFGRNN